MFIKNMACSLLWTMANLFLYRCTLLGGLPDHCDLVDFNGNQLMIMCTTSLEPPATTTPPRTYIETTTQPLPTTTEQMDTVSTTGSIPLETTSTPPAIVQTSTNPLTSTTFASVPSTTTLSPQGTTTPRNPTQHPQNLSWFTNDTTTNIPSKLLRRTNPTATPENANMEGVVIGLVSTLVVIVMAISVFTTVYCYKAHKQKKTQKEVRPSQVNIEISPKAHDPLIQKGKPVSQRTLGKNLKNMSRDEWAKLQKKINANKSFNTRRREHKDRQLKLNEVNQVKSRKEFKGQLLPAGKTNTHVRRAPPAVPAPVVNRNNKPMIPVRKSLSMVNVREKINQFEK
jgi:hypothetical protein